MDGSIQVLSSFVATNFRKNPGSKQHPADCPSGLGGSRTWKFQVPAAVRVGVPGDPDKLVVLYTVYTQADRKMEKWMARLPNPCQTLHHYIRPAETRINSGHTSISAWLPQTLRGTRFHHHWCPTARSQTLKVSGIIRLQFTIEYNLGQCSDRFREVHLIYSAVHHTNSPSVLFTDPGHPFSLP